MISARKKYYLFQTRNVLVFFSFFFFLFPLFTHAEYIDSFIADVAVHEDSSFDVTEDITYSFSGTPEPRHGIFRCIPTVHQDPPSSIFKERYFDIALTGVRMDGGEVPYTANDGRSEFCVKIGDANKTVSGTHTYRISYTVSGAMTYVEYGGADVYWNVTGDEWDVEIRSVDARVWSPDNILMSAKSCYRGFAGDTSSCTIRDGGDGSTHFMGNRLRPKEGLTFAQAVDRTKIPLDVRERWKLGSIIALIILIGLPLLGFWIYRYKTAHKTGRTIIPQYEPYPGVKPMYAGYLFDKRLDPHDITAGIVYLAEQGYIKIRKTDRKVLFFFEVDDYELTLLKPMTDVEGMFEDSLLELIFKAGSPVGTVTTLHALKNDDAMGRANVTRLSTLRDALRDDLRANGFFEGTGVGGKLLKVVFPAFIIWFALVFFGAIEAVLVAPILILFTLTLFVAFMVSERRTRKGYEALDWLKGFKDFLSVTEKERYIFHNAPEKNAEQFMEYLPYAIAFGVEEEWAKTFESITIPNPNWYEGGTSGVHSFNAVALTKSLGGFSTAFASSSTPSSSGGASSGGGSSGGGGGGGGGGSW